MNIPFPAILPAAALLVSLAFPAAADEAALKQRLGQRLPDLKIEQISKTPYPGLYEVYTDGVFLYGDESGNYLIQGTLIDTKTRNNVSAERLRQLTAITFEQLPLELAIPVVRGDGKRRLAVFEDPDCPYCRQLENELTKVDNVTIHIFLYPIEQLHRGATEKSRKIWCADNRTQAWLDAVQRGSVADNQGTCDNPLEKIAEFGRRLRINGTPTLFFGDGNRVSGSMPAARIEQLLGSATAAGKP